MRGSFDGVAGTPDSRHVMASTAPESTIQRIDIETGASVGSFTAHTARALRFFTRSGQQIISVSQNRNVRTWDVRLGDLTNSFVLDSESEHPMSSVAVSPGGKRVAVAFYWSWDKEIWDIRDEEPELVINRPGYVSQLVFTKDENSLFIGSDGGKLELYDIEVQTLRSFTGHRHGLRAIALNPDETQIVAGYRSGQVIVWDVASGDPLVTVTDGDVDVTSIDWSPDGKRIAVGKVDGTVHIWTLPESPRDQKQLR